VIALTDRAWRPEGPAVFIGNEEFPSDRPPAALASRTPRANLRGVHWKALVACALAAVVTGCATDPRGPCTPQPPAGTVGSICGFHNPEDVEPVPAADVLLVSELRRGGSDGALQALPLHPSAPEQLRPRRLWPTGDPSRDREKASPPLGDPACTDPPDAATFAPHGIATATTETPGFVRLAVVAHGQREAIELFDLVGRGEAAKLVWRGCIPMPPNTAANDVSFAPDGEVVVSNYMPSLHGWWGLYYTIKSALGSNTGDVMAWRPGQGWRHLPGSAAPSPNGVLVSPDGTMVYYAETGSGRVSRVPRTGGSADAAPQSVSIGGNPDNLFLSPRGTVLAATHTDGAAFLLCAFGLVPCRTGWSLFEIDPATMRATELLHHDGSVVGGVASAAEVEGTTYFGAVFDDRIGMWRPGP